MKKMTAVAAGLALMCGMAVTASAQRGARGGGMGPMQGPPGAGRARFETMAARQLFRGITLTDAQKSQLQKLRDDNRTQMQAFAKTAQANREALRTARENGDTVALKDARRQLEGERNTRIALRANAVRNARAVLTTDQQKVFDANRTRMERRVARAGRMMRFERMRMRRQAMMRGMHRWGGRGAMPGRFGPRPGRTPPGAPPDSSTSGGN
ncbi:MAG: Spy/CpxP family protein refolding chaperone [Gemmatimonadota bacterium]|nr:Spy/CpxP family protein refolding chaperone [Gemmatimonadota bacterium]